MTPPKGYSTVTPYLNYENTGEMIKWLEKAFGLIKKHSQSDALGAVVHAEMIIGEGVIMMGSPGGKFRNPKHLGQATHSLYIYVDDVEKHYERSLSAGAKIIEHPTNQQYGDRRYGAEDPEGHRWYFAERLVVN